MKDSRFFDQVALLIRTLPFVAEEKCFALKGGTALNLFLWDMPRLSVDIDLTYLPIKNRQDSLKDISSAIRRIKQKIETALPQVRVVTKTVSDTQTETSFTVALGGVQIKCEVNLVLRGTVFPPKLCVLCDEAQSQFNAYVEIETLSIADLYGGKLCAALDRQHPRDLFDVKQLLEHGGITSDILNAFVVYLASHSRPMNELLSPSLKDIQVVFEKEFLDMPRNKVEVAELVAVRSEMISQIHSRLTHEQKRFLISMKEGEPEWGILGIQGISELPGLHWKLINIKKMSKDKRDRALTKLKDTLAVY